MKGKIYHTGENKGITIPAGGIKHDAGKTRWDLLPLRTVEEIVKVYTFGAEKYGDNNWQNLPDGYDRYKAAMFRHLVASERGGTIGQRERLAAFGAHGVERNRPAAFLYGRFKQKGS